MLGGRADRADDAALLGVECEKAVGEVEQLLLLLLPRAWTAGAITLAPQGTAGVFDWSASWQLDR